MLGLNKAWYGDYSGNVVPFSSGGGVGSIYYTQFSSSNTTFNASTENKSFIILLSKYQCIFINLENTTFIRCQYTNKSEGIGDDRTSRFPTDLMSFPISLIDNRTYNMESAGNYGTFKITNNVLYFTTYTTVIMCYMI